MDVPCALRLSEPILTTTETVLANVDGCSVVQVYLPRDWSYSDYAQFTSWAGQYLAGRRIVIHGVPSRSGVALFIRAELAGAEFPD